ncbi:MAG TPA: cyanophycin synthetase, partial [Gemmatimonadales bacterium]|nr:cyanophycin synthetase [Gemmatimonadales bacterium]
GIPVRRLNDRSLVQLGLGRHLRRIESTMSDSTSIIAVELAQDKDLTKRVLGGIGLAVPAGGVARDLDAALALADEVGYPVLLKPLAANQGRGISPRLPDAEALRAAWARIVVEEAAGDGLAPPFVVERYAEGRDHRVVVVNGRVVAVTERVPAHVVGDGVRSIRALVAEVNRDPRRGDGHAHVLTRIPLDDVTTHFLALGGRTLDTVPARGERVVLRPTANLSTGGTSIDRTDEIHPDNATACEMAAGVIGLDIAGLDILTPDISVPFHENGAVIVEVNASPGIRMHTNPVEGRPRNVPGAILDMLFPPGRTATIPVIAVTGTNGKTTTTRLIAHLFRHTGKVVGFTTTDGVYLQTRLVVAGDMTGPFAANVILTNPAVEVAVLETARGGILRSGLGFEACDVGIVLNVAADHLGLGGVHTLEQLAEVKGLIPAVVKRRGHAVLNADDPLVYAMRERTRGDVVLFSCRPDAHAGDPRIREHLEDGGIATLIEGEEYVIRRGRLCIPVARVADVPLTLGGAAEFQHGNVLAAIAAAYVQGMRYEEIRAGLLSFFPSPALTPGRLNLVPVRRGRVLVDYAHNAAAIAGLMELVARIDAARRIGVLAAPGDRRDEDIRAIGRLSAGFDHVIIKEDDDRRGRGPGEVPTLLREGLLAAGYPPERIELVLAEADAVRRGLDRLDEHDLLVVMAVDVSAVLEQVRVVRRSV